MGGCTNCKGKGACDDHKSTMMGSVEAALEALYPTRTWGEIDDNASTIEPFSLEELEGLAEELASELNAQTFLRPGGDDEACDYIYVLCMGRAPCAIAVRDHGVPTPAEWQSVDADASSAHAERAASPEAMRSVIEELYLRIVIAQRTRHAAVQQVTVGVLRTEVGGEFVVREAPRAGVYDAPLLSRMQKLVAILPAYDLVHVDFGDIAHAPPGFTPGEWPDIYGLGSARPSIANYLFYPQPTTMIVTTLLASEST